MTPKEVEAGKNETCDRNANDDHVVDFITSSLPGQVTFLSS